MKTADQTGSINLFRLNPQLRMLSHIAKWMTLNFQWIHLHYICAIQRDKGRRRFVVLR